MGKSKQQAKVKGNLKPASSSRAAELVGQSGSLPLGNLGGFAQFASPSLGASISRPATPGSDSSDSMALDPELTVIVKKISKRDATTKLKALEELDTYLHDHASAVAALLPTWIALYGKLALEVDRRVRLASAHLHQFVTQHAKKKLAPYLKDCIGPWMVAMFDQSKDIAAVARRSFEGVFAEDKRQGVIVFCQKELLDYVGEMLLVKTEDTLSDARYVTPEDMAAKYARVIASCFYILSYLTEQLPVEERNKAAAEYNGLFDSATVWAFVSHANPVIRKAVHYFIKTLLQQSQEVIAARLDMISPPFFKSVLSEKEPAVHSDMWDALLLFTDKIPDAWYVFGKKSPVAKLCGFLRAGLHGSPAIAYPSVIVLLDRLSAKMKQEDNFYKDVFTSFWAGLASIHLTVKGARDLVSAYMECAVYFADKTANEGQVATAEYLVKEAMYQPMLSYFVPTKSTEAMNERLPTANGVPMATSTALLAATKNNTLAAAVPALISRVSEIWAQYVLDGTYARSTLAMPDVCDRIYTFLSAFYLHGTDAAHAQMVDTLVSLLPAAIDSALVHKEHAPCLLRLVRRVLDEYKDVVLAQLDVSALMSTLLQVETTVPSACMEDLVHIYTLLNTGANQCALAPLLARLETMRADRGRQCGALLALLRLVAGNTNISEQLDAIIKDVASELLSQGEHQLTMSVEDRDMLESVVRESLLQQKGTATYDAIVSLLVSSLSAANKSHWSAQDGAAASCLAVLASLKEDDTLAVFSGALGDELVCQVFDAMFLSAASEAEAATIQPLAQSVWNHLRPGIGAHEKTLLKHVAHAITDINHKTSSMEMVQQARELLGALYEDSSSSGYFDGVTTLMGSASAWQDMYKAFQSSRTLEYMASSVTNGYAGMDDQSLYEDKDELYPVAYDASGASALARLAMFTSSLISDLGVGAFFEEKERDWVVHYLMVIALECQDGLAMQGLTRFWQEKPLLDETFVLQVETFIQQAHAVFDAWLTLLFQQQKSVQPDLCHQILSIVSNGASQASHLSRLASSVAEILLLPRDQTDAYYATLVQMLMDRLITLDHWTLAQLEPWLALVKPDAKKLAPLCKVAVLTSIKPIVGESSKFRYMQSDCANRLAGGQAMQIFDDSDEAWQWLTLLNASSLSFGAIAIPPQRLMFLISTIRGWFGQDFDDHLGVTERRKVHVQMALLFGHMSDAVQQVAGSQWHFFMDCVCDFIQYNEADDPSGLPVMFGALNLLSTLMGLAADGSTEIKDALDDRWADLHAALWQSFVAEKDAETPISQPRRHYQCLLADLIGRVPAKIVQAQADFATVLQLLKHTANESVQTRAYFILQEWIKTRIADLSVNVEFSANDELREPNHIEQGLIDLLLRVPPLPDWSESLLGAHKHELFSYLVSWLLMLDHFNDITFKLKQQFTDQLKRVEAVDTLMPALCHILHIGSSQGHAFFDLSLWDTSIYDLQGFDMSVETSYSLLAAHIYFKALKHIPSLVRSWWVNYKQRQTVIAVERYTQSFFSDILINNELDTVNRADVKEQLEDNDNEFRVKTLRTTHEVAAAYHVDEQEMRISIKLPSNYPLQQISVDGVQKVGVSEKQWRGWMFAITAVIGSQNGNLVDALTVFKRNANLHFDGVGDCVICYSIISVLDRSIPTKQCRTCKNKFHASCLYKWFRSSSSTSCPLCRTVF
ncbi:hypothetical protein BC940DRAFT_306342 [Gongronella butleri]|nr:hypothetical protein BC940DRAFT_306342 [Gongronella butleri]